MARWIAVAALVLTGCGNTLVQQLELQRDQLLRIERAAGQARDAAAAGQFRPDRYDFYLMLNRTIFDKILGSFDGLTTEVQAGDRSIRFTLSSLRMNFRPGNPEVSIVALARDEASGVQAAVDMDARLILEGDRAVPDQLYLRLVATRLVPRLSWGPFSSDRSRFAQRILALEAVRLTERLPRVSLPLQRQFQMGGPSGSHTITFPTGEGQLTGAVSYPATLTKGRFVVRQIVFLRNGVHLFADVEGL